MRSKLSPSICLVLRIVVTLGLGFLFVVRLDIHATVLKIGAVGLGPFVLATILLLLNVVLTGPRWRIILLKQYTVSTPMAFLLKLTIIGFFFNQVLPSGIGGDAIRVWLLRQHDVATGIAARSVIIDRLFGLSVLFLFVAAVFPYVLATNNDSRFRVALIILLCIGAACALIFAFLVYAWRTRMTLRAIQFFVILAGDTISIVNAPRAFSTCVALTVVSNFLPILAFAAIARSLGVQVDFLNYIAIVPAALLLAALPLSIAGWGVREAAIIGCLAAYGISSEVAFALSITFGLALTLAALPGGVIWLIDPGVSRYAPGSIDRK